MTDDIIHDALDKLRGAVTIVYPMGLPPHDPIRLEFEGQEDLSGTQVYIYIRFMCRYIDWGGGGGGGGARQRLARCFRLMAR